MSRSQGRAGRQAYKHTGDDRHTQTQTAVRLKKKCCVSTETMLFMLLNTFFFYFFFNCVSWLIVIFIAILLLCETSQSQNATFLPVQTTAAVERQDAEGMLRFF